MACDVVDEEFGVDALAHQPSVMVGKAGHQRIHRTLTRLFPQFSESKQSA
jgi:hypothetical protein